MEGVVDNRPPSEQAELPLDLAEADAAIWRTEGTAPRQVKVILTPIRGATLATIVQQEWSGRQRVETRVFAQRLASATRMDWATDPWTSLRACIWTLAACLEA